MREARKALKEYDTYEEYKEARKEKLIQQIMDTVVMGSHPHRRTVESIVEAIFQVQEEGDARRFRDIQCNYSALMYLITEQQALIAKLLEELLQMGLMPDEILVKITEVYGDGEILDPIYNELYRRFTAYFVRVWEALKTGEDEEPATVADLRKGKDDGPNKDVLPE